MPIVLGETEAAPFEPMPEWYWIHRVSIRDFEEGAGGNDSYAAGRTVFALVKDEQKITAGADGAEIVSSTQVDVPFDEDVPIGSLVKVWPNYSGAREAAVVAIARNHNGPLPSYQTLSLE